MATAEAPAQPKETFSKESIEKITARPMGGEGVLEIELSDNLTIDMDFESEVEDGHATLTAVSQIDEEGEPLSVSVQQLIGLLDPSIQLPGVLGTVKIELEYLLFSYDAGGEGKPSKWVLGVDLSFAAPDLSKVPLIGALVKDLELKLVDDLLLLYTTGALTREEVSALNEKLPEDKPKIAIPKEAGDNTVVLHPGLNLSGHFSFSADAPLTWSEDKDKDKDRDKDSEASAEGGEGGSEGGSEGGEGADSGEAPDADAVKLEVDLWLKVQKKFGPFSIDKIGVGFDLAKLELAFMLDAGIAAGGFSLDLDQFTIKNPLTRFAPEFDIKGIAIAYVNPQLELAGALVKLTGRDDTGAQYTEYVGEIKIAIGDEITVVAIGAYATYDHAPSFFAYGFVGFPIPLAPTDIEIDGFALGFGVNQAIHAPDPRDVSKFPLVAQVMPGAPDRDDNLADEDKQSQAKELIEQFDDLTDYIYPHLNTFFFAGGVKLKGYDMLDGFALGIIEAGARFEVDLMGLGSVTLPTPKSGDDGESTTTLAYIGLSFIASVAFSDGYLGACASITPDSYFIMPGAAPTGGFAAYAWWAGEHAGDFVISVGGYHPDFDVPRHYPAVSRLSVPIGEIIPGLPHAVASGYAALCPHAIMFGAGFETVWSIWIATISLSVNLDVLIAWKPLHLDASIAITLTLTANLWVVHISIEIGAKLSFWGPLPSFPQFATRLELHAGPISLVITNPSDADSASGPAPIPWSEFKASFLPKDDQAVCPVRLNKGMVAQRKQGDGTTLFIVNPKDVRLTADSLIPVQKSALGDGTPAPVAGANTQFGVAPMGIGLGSVESVQRIRILRDGEAALELFAFTPILRRAPRAMWGDALTPDLNGERFIEDLHTGFQIVPSQPPKPGATRDIARRKLLFDPTTMEYSYGSLLPFERIYPSSDEQALLEAMGFGSSEPS